MFRKVWVHVLIAVVVAAVSGAFGAGRRSAPPSAERVVTVTGGDRAVPETPVSVVLSAGAAGFFTLRLDTGRAAVPCQIDRQDGRLRVTWIVPGLKPRQSLTYRLVPTREAPQGQAVVVRRVGDDAEVQLRGQLFTRYVTKGANKPYFYPLIGPTGVPITRHFPMREVAGETRDHVHHRSFWFTHGDVNGFDFWSEGASAARTVHAAYEVLESGPVFGRLRTRVNWLAPNGDKVCEDVRELRVYATSHGRLVDFDVTVRAGEQAVTFGDTKEGTLGIRVASSMDVTRRQGHILNSRGDKDTAAWGKRAEWCDYWGSVGGKTVGIAIMDHPTSFRHPTYWHVRDYGLFAANPFGLRDFTGDRSANGSHTIPANGTLSFRYRIYLHEGDAEQARVADVADAYVNPPKVEVR
ncbi:MAG: PmoA family protein [Armatimonadota bacterium]